MTNPSFRFTLRCLLAGAIFGVITATTPGLITAQDSSDTRLLSESAISAANIAFVYDGDL